MDEEEALIAIRIINDLEDAEEQIVNHVPRNYYHYQRQNPFERLTEEQFIKHFRLTKNLARDLIETVSPFLQPPTRRSAITLETKVLIALLFYGHGCYQSSVAKNLFAGVSQSSVSRCLREVTDAIIRDEIMNRWVHFPANLNELTQLRRRFYTKYHMPGTVGAIDCTHVAIAAPNEDEHVYVNRKGYHSLNVQLICDENLKITHVNSRYPGSCHDSYIWNQSNISEILEQIYRHDNHNPFFLLGDSGYPLRPWLITAFRDPPLPNTPEERFNNRMKSVRSIIERCNGVLKNRFRCLLKHRVLHYHPRIAANIVKACVVLHNMCISHNIPEPEIDEEVVNADFGIIDEHQAPPFINNLGRMNPDLAAAQALRQTIIHNHFNR